MTHLTIWRQRMLSVVFPLAVMAGAVWLYMSEPAWLETLRLKLFDEYQRLSPRMYEPLPVTIIDIDERSLAALGQWPWSRDILAGLTDRLRESGAAALGLDIVFAESDRTSPSALLPKWQFVSPESITADIPDNDAMFAQAVATFNVVTGIVLHDTPSALPAKKFGMVTQGDGTIAEFVSSYDGVIESLPLLTDAATGNGALNSVPDKDGMIRRVPLLFNVGGQVMPGLAAETLRIAQGASTYVVRSSKSGITDIRIGEFTIPTDKRGHIWVHYTPFEQARYISALDVIQGRLAEERLAGHIILLGTSAAGLKDIRTTPLNEVTNGVEIHAQALEQIMLQHFLYRPDWITSAELMYTLLTACLVWGMLARFSAITGAVCSTFCITGSLGLSWYGFTQHHFLLDPLTPALTLLLLYLGESLRRYILTERERTTVRTAFSRYMSPALVEKLARQPDSLTLGGEMRTMTVLFCDIRGFTTISEQYDAQGLTSFINSFLTPMTNIILKHHGTIDKYMGDCIMAFWNAPLDDAAHEQHACTAALAMIDALALLNDTRRKEASNSDKAFIPVNIGIGLNTDICCVGNMGSDQRFDYSVLGDGVNLASRLEGQSKYYGVNIVIGEQTCRKVPAFATLELDMIKVKGKTQAVRIFALLGDNTLADNTIWDKLRQANLSMLECYRDQDWETALCWLETLRDCATSLELDLNIYCKLYQQRINDYQLNYPPVDWNGVYIATSK